MKTLLELLLMSAPFIFNGVIMYLLTPKPLYESDKMRLFMGVLFVSIFCLLYSGWAEQAFQRIQDM